MRSRVGSEGEGGDRLFLGPDRSPAVTTALVCTNHQETVTWPAMAAVNRTVERHAALSAALSAASDIDSLAMALLEPALHVRGPTVFTAYTAIYRPTEGAVDYVWPGKRWRQSLDAFLPGEYQHDYDT